MLLGRSGTVPPACIVPVFSGFVPTLQSLDESADDIGKVLKLVSFLAAEDLTAEQLEGLRCEARAAKVLADDHLLKPHSDDSEGTQRERAPAVLLAALTMSAVSAMHAPATDK